MKKYLIFVQGFTANDDGAAMLLVYRENNAIQSEFFVAESKEALKKHMKECSPYAKEFHQGENIIISGEPHPYDTFLSLLDQTIDRSIPVYDSEKINEADMNLLNISGRSMMSTISYLINSMKIKNPAQIYKKYRESGMESDEKINIRKIIDINNYTIDTPEEYLTISPILSEIYLNSHIGKSIADNIDKIKEIVIRMSSDYSGKNMTEMELFCIPNFYGIASNNLIHENVGKINWALVRNPPSEFDLFHNPIKICTQDNAKLEYLYDLLPDKVRFNPEFIISYFRKNKTLPKNLLNDENLWDSIFSVYSSSAVNYLFGSTEYNSISITAAFYHDLPDNIKIRMPINSIISIVNNEKIDFNDIPQAYKINPIIIAAMLDSESDSIRQKCSAWLCTNIDTLPEEIINNNLLLSRALKIYRGDPSYAIISKIAKRRGMEVNEINNEKIWRSLSRASSREFIDAVSHARASLSEEEIITSLKQLLNNPFSFIQLSATQLLEDLYARDPALFQNIKNDNNLNHIISSVLMQYEHQKAPIEKHEEKPVNHIQVDQDIAV